MARDSWSLRHHPSAARHCSRTMEMTATILFFVCIFVSLWRNKRLLRLSSLQHRGYRWYGRLFWSGLPFCVCTHDVVVPSDPVPQEPSTWRVWDSLSKSQGVARRRVWLHWAAGILCAKITPLGPVIPLGPGDWTPVLLLACSHGEHFTELSRFPSPELKLAAVYPPKRTAICPKF